MGVPSVLRYAMRIQPESRTLYMNAERSMMSEGRSRRIAAGFASIAAAWRWKWIGRVVVVLDMDVLYDTLS